MKTILDCFIRLKGSLEYHSNRIFIIYYCILKLYLRMKINYIIRISFWYLWNMIQIDENIYTKI